MPIFFVVLFAGGAGFALGKGTDGLADVVKWSVAGGVLFVGAKALKII